jgi:hypothetical protein
MDAMAFHSPVRLGARRRALTALAVSVMSCGITAGCAAPRGGPPLPDPPGPPRQYVCHAAEGAIVVDGRLDEPAWQAASWSEPFVDISGRGRPPPAWETRMKLTWDREALHVAARLEEPHVWATLRQRDAIVFQDNDFEVFIDPDGDGRDYHEIEINALGTVFDLLLRRTYREGGPALHDWNLEGLRAAVFVDGTLNDPRDVDRGWSVEMSLPWRSMISRGATTHPPGPPAVGDRWRMNFSRVEWQVTIGPDGYARVPGRAEDNWVWSPQGLVDMHLPARWGIVQFAGPATGNSCAWPPPPARAPAGRGR